MPRDERQKDLFRPALDQIIDLGHPLVRLAGEIDWEFLEQRFAAVCEAGAGQPPLPARLTAGLFILKHTHSLSDEVLCARWLENPYYQYFCGEQAFRHELPFDRSSMTRWRQRLAPALSVAVPAFGAGRPSSVGAVASSSGSAGSFAAGLSLSPCSAGCRKPLHPVASAGMLSRTPCKQRGVSF
jgi:hypothetical protein